MYPGKIHRLLKLTPTMATLIVYYLVRRGMTLARTSTKLSEHGIPLSVIALQKYLRLGRAGEMPYAALWAPIYEAFPDWPWHSQARANRSKSRKRWCRKHPWTQAQRDLASSEKRQLVLNRKRLGLPYNPQLGKPLSEAQKAKYRVARMAWEARVNAGEIPRHKNPEKVAEALRQREERRRVKREQDALRAARQREIRQAPSRLFDRRAGAAIRVHS